MYELIRPLLFKFDPAVPGFAECSVDETGAALDDLAAAGSRAVSLHDDGVFLCEHRLDAAGRS